MKWIKIEHYLLQTGITSRGSARCWSFSWLAKKKMTSCSKLVKALLSVWEIVLCSSLVQKPSRSLQASLAKSRSRTSGEATETIANASLSSLIVAQPTWKKISWCTVVENNKKMSYLLKIFRSKFNFRKNSKFLLTSLVESNFIFEFIAWKFNVVTFKVLFLLFQHFLWQK